MDIWDRVIVPSIRDKYQSMKCNLQNKIKSVYMSMRIFFEYATQNLLMQRSHNKIIATKNYLDWINRSSLLKRNDASSSISRSSNSIYRYYI